MKRIITTLTIVAVATLNYGCHTSGETVFHSVSIRRQASIEMNQSQQPGLNRAIKRRIQDNVYLAGLQTITFNRDTQAGEQMASLSELNARYRAALLMASAEMASK